MSEQKMYKIGQAARKLGVETSVLRYWESEFPQLHPRRTSTGQRLYSLLDLEIAGKIKTLLYEEKITIEGARNRLAKKEDLSLLPLIVSELDKIRELLSGK